MTLFNAPIRRPRHREAALDAGVALLEAKGYVRRATDPADARAKLVL